jgi:hypothetical protein
MNCGLAINQVTNMAAITMGTSASSTPTSPGASGIAFLDLKQSNPQNAFSAAVQASNHVSEGVVWDPGLKLILSPNEGNVTPPTCATCQYSIDKNGVYDLFDSSAVPSAITTSGQAVSAPEFANPVYTLPGGGTGTTELDSAAEDCSTGIALASDEFTHSVYIADLTQASFTPGGELPGTWTAAQQFVSLPAFSTASNSAGISGIAVAPGPDPAGLHLAVITGEFGGNQIGVLELPATTGSGTPNILDYATAYLPNVPASQCTSNCSWYAGFDPHAVTTYLSPNDGKAYALIANAAPPKWIAVVDLAALLTAPRAGPDGVNSVNTTYDLIANGVVRYVATGN